MSRVLGPGGPSQHAGIGAVVAGRVTTFRVWAPASKQVTLVVEHTGGPADERPLAGQGDGMFRGHFDDLPAGTRYRYRLDGDGPFPDPASRFQPDGVHGASLVVDPGQFSWSDGGWAGVALRHLVIYELHVGTFSPAGTFQGVRERLQHVRDLGVTAIELMPIADFPGSRNWGYDGVSLFAPARCYGTPDDLRQLVNEAHALGIAVLLDVVFNHTGPDGSYLSRFSPYYFTGRHPSPWGDGVDVDGEQSAQVREFFIQNALHWVHEYHLDGLRLDATHAIHDQSARHFLAELTTRLHESAPARPIHVIAEDHRNLATMVTPPEEFGWGLDAVWADDFHHQVRRLLAGDADGYYRDFTGTTADLAATLRQGWFYTGQYSEHLKEPRGTDPSAIPARRLVVCLQNHDQVGNRALGDRLHHQIDAAAFRAASVVLLTAPQTPLLFMGQEWAATSPFQYFTDHEAGLGRLVTEGRRREFKDFAAFAEAGAEAAIPDPQAETTFLGSRLDWSEPEREPHASMMRLYAAVLAFRHRELEREDTSGFSADAYDADTLIMSWTPSAGDHHLVVVRLRGAGMVDTGRSELATRTIAPWVAVLTSEDREFTVSPAPATISGTGVAPLIAFAGPAAVIFRARPGHVHMRSDTRVGTSAAASAP